MTDFAATRKPARRAAVAEALGSSDPVSPITRELSEYVAGALARPLPAEVAEKTRHHLLDTLAAMVSGSRLPPGRRAIAYVRAQGGRRQATVVGSRTVTTASNAALANGMSAHADETDDSHIGGRFHPGCAVVPAALAAAELADRDGASLLGAVALGYDVGARFVMALGLSGAYGRPHSTHSLGGLFGAAAAAGALLGLDARQIRFQLSYAVQQASGLAYWMRDPDHIEKAFDFGGMPARNALAAATMAAAGFTGVEDPLAGARTFLEAFAEAPRPEALVERAGQPVRDHAGVDQEVVRRGADPGGARCPRDPDARARHRGSRRPAASPSACPTTGPSWSTTARCRTCACSTCWRCCCWTARSAFAAAHDQARMRDPSILALRRRIRLVPEAELTRALPPRQAIVEIETPDGRRLAQRTRAVRGTPDNPMARQEVEAKAQDLLAPVLGAERARALTIEIRRIERLTAVRALRPLLQA